MPSESATAPMAEGAGIEVIPFLITEAQRRVEPALDAAFTSMLEPRHAPDTASHAVPAMLLEAMRYSTMDAGKRLRPALVLGGALAVGGEIDEAIAGACAVELVHNYSLVHDDLPALDDDDVRRGKASCHRRYGEATAILAGDALLTEAMRVLVDRKAIPKSPKVRARYRMRAACELFLAAGAGGMIGGQHDDVVRGRDARDARDVRDVRNERDAGDGRNGGDAGDGGDAGTIVIGALDEGGRRRALLSIHRRKTGLLIRASVAVGALLCGASSSDVRALRRFGEEIGLAFQLVDDALDGDGIAALDGKDMALAEARAATQRGVDALSRFGKRGVPLSSLASFIVRRTQ